MIEMLVAAFVMAIGILGLAMLQTYAIRTQAGSRAVDQAVLIGKRILEQAELTGRYSLYASRKSVAPVTPSPDYFGANTFTLYYSPAGLPTDGSGFFTAVVTPTTAAGNGIVAPVQGLGGIGMVSVTVSWQEAIAGANQTTTRQITLSRRITYANS
jgi:Tfp pilus assembly protein PilV